MFDNERGNNKDLVMYISLQKEVSCIVRTIQKGLSGEICYEVAVWSGSAMVLVCVGV